MQGIRKLEELHNDSAAQIDQLRDQLTSITDLANNQRTQLAQLKNTYAQTQQQIQTLQTNVTTGHQESVQALREALNATV